MKYPTILTSNQRSPYLFVYNEEVLSPPISAQSPVARSVKVVYCYCPPHSFTDYAYAIANQTRTRPKFLSTLRKSGPSPTQNLGQVSLGQAQVFRVHTSMGQAQVFENLGRAWASLCSVDTAIDQAQGICTESIGLQLSN